MRRLEFQIAGQRRQATIRQLVIAGWAGRDTAEVEHHIAELEAIGVRRPRTVPCFYGVGANLLTCADAIEVCGPDSSGEVEVILVCLDGELFVGIGSDHTDRRVESYGVTVSKQMCPKPIGRELWPLSAVRDHWDGLVLRSWVTRDGERMLYQEGTVARLLTPWTLMERFADAGGLFTPGCAMFCGTLPVLGKMGASEKFEIELEDPIHGRYLKHAYNTRTLPYSD